ncbi:CMT1A duplicated region transcript 4 protein homolog isoform X2 [Sceloporus undulatus]|nr:CMT1A duplicated region transcript 4 protein homolog isoform X2 [Sceloporus undulatus]
MKTTMAFSSKNPLKDRSLVSGNIGISPHLICTCEWPAYTTYTSPMVKKLVEEDKSRIEGLLGTPRGSSQRSSSSQAHLHQKKYSRGSQEVGITGASPGTPRFSTTISPFRVTKDSATGYGGLGVLSSDSPLGTSITQNLVIFSRRRIPLRVLPMKLPDAASKHVALQE